MVAVSSPESESVVRSGKVPPGFRKKKRRNQAQQTGGQAGRRATHRRFWLPLRDQGLICRILDSNSSDVEFSRGVSTAARWLGTEWRGTRCAEAREEKKLILSRTATKKGLRWPAPFLAACFGRHVSSSRLSCEDRR